MKQFYILLILSLMNLTFFENCTKIEINHRLEILSQLAVVMAPLPYLRLPSGHIRLSSDINVLQKP